MIKSELEEIQLDAQALKESIWSYLERNNIKHKGLKESVNEVLDLLEEVEIK
jgi:hypothetical protein